MRACIRISPGAIEPAQTDRGSRVRARELESSSRAIAARFYRPPLSGLRTHAGYAPGMLLELPNVSLLPAAMAYESLLEYCICGTPSQASLSSTAQPYPDLREQASLCGPGRLGEDVAWLWLSTYGSAPVAEHQPSR